MSHIAWTDETWNPSGGCTRKSRGCDNCYAFTLHDRRYAAWKAGRWPTAPTQYHRPFSATWKSPGGGVGAQGVQLFPDRLATPLHWRAPRRIFVGSMTDTFHEDMPDDYLVRIWATMAATPHHVYQVLTKRPERMADWLWRVDQRAIQMEEGQLRAAAAPARQRRPARASAHPWAWPLPNVHLGTSVEDQATADARVPALLLAPTPVRFLSIEPQLAPVDLAPWLARWAEEGDGDGGARLHWAIVGGESGARARPFELTWARVLIRQCQEAGTAVFMKQLGSVWAREERGRHPHGSDPSQWPEDLRVRAYPTTLARDLVPL